MSNPAFDHLKGLVIEDNVHMRTLLRSLLNSLGVKHVHEAADGTAGFAELCARQPDFVLSDLSMKPVDGIAFTKMVRNSKESPNPYVPIIMVTGHTERALVTAARDCGITEFIAKPVTTQSLLLRLTEIVERPRRFVRCDGYFGPDRRRRNNPLYGGPWRRHDDLQNDLDIK